MGITSDLIAINRRVKLLTDVYGSLINDYRGLFALSVSSKNPGLALVRRKFTDAAVRIGDRRIREYRQYLKTATNGVIQQALDAALSPEERAAFYAKNEKRLQDYSEEMTQFTTFSVEGLVRRDIKFGRDQLRTIGFNVMMTMTNAGIKNAIKGAVVKNMVAGNNYTGNNGKEWGSINSVGFITRQHLITVFNEITLLAGANAGDTEFVIKTFNKTNQFSDSVISPSNYEEIKSRAFHPNSNALIYRKNKSPMTSIDG